MKPINEEPDYLERLRNAKGNIEEHINFLQISSDSVMGQTFTLVLDTLETDIKRIEILRHY